MKKRTLRVCAFLAAMLLILAGCGDNVSSPDDIVTPPSNTGEPTDSNTPNDAAPGEVAEGDYWLRPYIDTLNLSTVMIDDITSRTYPEGDSFEDNIWTRSIKEDLNIEVETLWAQGGSNGIEKLNLQIMGGNIPDFFLATTTDIEFLLEAGLICDMTEMIDKYLSPLAKEIIAGAGDTAYLGAQREDRLYGLPLIASSTINAPMVWVREDWRIDMALPEPESMQDVIDIAYAFKDRSSTTYGLGIQSDSFFSNTNFGLTGLFSVFGAYPDTYFEKDGELVYGSVQPEVKTALETVRKYYDDGLIDPEFITKNEANLTADCINGEIGLFLGSVWFPWSEIANAVKEEPEMQWKAYPVKDYEGNDVQVKLQSNCTQYYVVSKACQNPEAVVKLMSYMVEKQYGASRDQAYSELDGIYMLWRAPVQTFAENFNTEQALAITALYNNPDISLDELPKSQAGFHAENVEFAENVKAVMNGSMSDDDITAHMWTIERCYGPNGSYHIVDNYNKKDLYKREMFYGAPTQTMRDRKSYLNDLQSNAYAEFVTGVRDIATWDDFVATFQSNGGEQILTEVNEWYDKVNG